MPVIEGYPRPDWRGIGELIQQQSETEWAGSWIAWARAWLEATAMHLPDGYRVAETDNFFVLSAQNDRYVELLGGFCERALGTINDGLKGIAEDEGFGKHAVLIFDDQDHYYRYIAPFYPEDGEFILSAGVFLHSDYGHFALPFLEMSDAEATVAHELTHACLRHLPLPVWLDEGFAVSVEDDLCGTQPLSMETERLAEHAAFWNAATIQDFWHGRSFSRPDEGSPLSYELARYCVRALAHDYDAFAQFANRASYSDAGEAAAIEVFGGSLGGLIHQFFGDGDWSPDPEYWPEDGAD